MFATIIMVILFIMQLSNYLTVTIKSEMYIDKLHEKEEVLIIY